MYLKDKTSRDTVPLGKLFISIASFPKRKSPILKFWSKSIEL